MKRILSLILVAIFSMLCLVGCGEKDRILYKSAKLTKYVDLADYKGIKVDKSSKEFIKIYNELIVTDIIQNKLHEETAVTEGEIENGDIANIDYVGKKDGVAFEGGTASGYDLTIGSNSFIDGFESGLLGAEIGTTVDLNLKFPENYKSTELAGKKVVFTVKINSVKKAKKPADYYSELGYKTLEAYESEKNNIALDEYILNIIFEKSKIKDYPKEDIEILKASLTPMLEKELEYYGMTLDQYITQIGMTKESFEKSFLEEQVYPLMNEQMPLYAILDKERVEVTTEDVNSKIDETVKEYNDSGITAEVLTEYYGEYYFENMVVSEKVVEILKEYAEIK